MTTRERSVTVVIPSRGTRERAELLLRAIACVRAQRGVRAVPLVVLNGASRTPDVEGALRRLEGVRLLVQDEADLPSAHRAGRAAVDTAYFGSLDEDDLLLPGALERRVQALEHEATCDVIVTNGIVRSAGMDAVHVVDAIPDGVDAIRVLRRRNWLLPGAWLARTERVGVSLFDGMPRFRECTFLAYRFALEYRMRWLQEPTVVYHVGTPGAASRSREYVLGQVEALRALLALPLPSTARRHLRWAIAAGLHECADFLWAEGELDASWRLHLQSLTAYGGLRYLWFTRHLVAASLRRARDLRRGGSE
jgi:hypothetical protein